MKTIDMLRLAALDAAHRRTRVLLTVLGIILGVGSMIALVSLGQGYQANVSKQLSGVGAEIFTITPGQSQVDLEIGRTEISQLAGTAAPITTRDARIVASTPGVLLVNGVVSGQGTLSYHTRNVGLKFQGVDPAVWKQLAVTPVESGRLLTAGDSGVIVLGNSVAHAYFRQPVTLNQQVALNGRELRVVGILKPGGSFAQTDNDVFLPQQDARALTNLTADQLSYITARAAPGADPARVAAQVDARLLATHHVTAQNRDFTILTAQALHSKLAELLAGLSAFVAGVAGIALIVGGIGIANTMLMAVLERQRQIGILKALGATNREIARMFTLEAVLLGLFGGIIGITLGLLVAEIVTIVGIEELSGVNAIHAVVSLPVIALGLAFAVVTGVLAGVLPAIRASRLQTADVLRAE